MMSRQVSAALILVVIAAAIALSGAQRGRGQNRWGMYEHEMQDPINDPPDAAEKTEFAFGRLRYRSHRDGWGYSRWGIDANKSDRQFIAGLRRLTRVHARSIEEIIDVDSDEIFNWPWMFGVAVGDWVLSDSQALRLKNFFERGGFMMVDDFHAEREWRDFMTGVHKMFPNATVVELENDNPIFHIPTTLRIASRFQVQTLSTGPVMSAGALSRTGVACWTIRAG